MSKVIFAIEESDFIESGYKKIHAFPCRDLRDPEKIVFDGSREGLMDALDDYGHDIIEAGESDIDGTLDYWMCPCARKALKS